MKCPFCGREIGESNRFCKYCGRSLQNMTASGASDGQKMESFERNMPSETPTEKKPKRSHKTVLIILIAAAAVVLAAAAVIVFFMKGGGSLQKHDLSNESLSESYEDTKTSESEEDSKLLESEDKRQSESEKESEGDMPQETGKENEADTQQETGKESEADTLPETEETSEVLESESTKGRLSADDVDVEQTVLDIRELYNAIVGHINAGDYTQWAVSDTVTGYADGGSIKAIIASRETDGGYSRSYYFDESGNLIFAYLEGSDSHRFYMKEGQIVRWRYCADAFNNDEAVNHDMETTSECLTWEEYILKEAAALKNEMKKVMS